jgi:hypothetical protein
VLGLRESRDEPARAWRAGPSASWDGSANANLKFGIIHDLGQSDGDTVNGVTLSTTSQQWQDRYNAWRTSYRRDSRWQRNGPSVSME